MAIIKITNENFEEEVSKSEIPVLVDFWASWCMPCKMMAPVLDEIEKEMGQSVKIGKVNVDEEPSLASKFGIMSIPTFLIFRDGNVVDMTVGMQSKEELMKILK